MEENPFYKPSGDGRKEETERLRLKGGIASR